MGELVDKYRIPFDPDCTDQTFVLDIEALAYNDRLERVPIRFRVKVRWHDFGKGDVQSGSNRCNWSAEIETGSSHFHFGCDISQDDYAWLYLNYFYLGSYVLSSNAVGVDYLNNFTMSLEICLRHSDSDGSYFDVGYILHQRLPLCWTSQI